MSDKAERQNQLCAAAFAAEQAGQLSRAVELYREAVACDPANPTPYLFFGFALAATGNDAGATEVWSLGADLDARLINAWRVEGTDVDVKNRSKRAAEAVQRHFTILHKNSLATWQAENPHANIDRIAAAIWCQTHDQSFEYAHPRQRPQLFFVPDLPPVPVYSDDAMPWATTLESEWQDIRDEFLALSESAADEQSPYVGAEALNLGAEWSPLAASLNWGSFHLYKKGVANQRLIDMLPRTIQALQSVPLVQTPTGPVEILFSVLQGKQRIPPHFGVANTDMTVHLPLVVTSDSGIRVVDETYDWHEGRVFAFDDTFEHESWNMSDETRVNLLFEAWHPDLSVDEQSAASAAVAARKNWNQSRSIAH